MADCVELHLLREIWVYFSSAKIAYQISRGKDFLDAVYIWLHSTLNEKDKTVI